jgi:integrase
MVALGQAVDGIVGGAIVKAAPQPAESPTSFRTFAKRWTSGELHRLYPDHVRQKRTADDDVFRLERHVYPVIGDRELATLTIDDALGVLRRLPSDLAPASRRHVAQLMTRIFSLAVYPCRLLAASPLPRGFLPRLRRQKAKAAIYPDEDARLVSRPADVVPLANRVLYGFLAREGMRSSEAVRMTWADLDLERGAVRLDRNKTDDPRAWALDPGTADALRRWRALRKREPSDALVFGGVADRGHLAEAFRDHLRAAGVDRAELFEDSDARRPIRLHDLRATFVTVALAAGRTEAFVTARTGHRSSIQVAAYRRLAGTFAEIGVAWFGSLAELVPELAAVTRLPEPAAPPSGETPERGASAGKCTGRDSNPHALRRRNLKTAASATHEDCRDVTASEEHDSGPADAPQPPGAAASDDPIQRLTRVAADASAACRWDVVEAALAELRALRVAGANVADLATERKRRRRP